MRKTTKTILTSALCALTLLATGLGVQAAVGATKNLDVANAETQPLVIKGKTLTVSNNVNVSFLVPIEAGDKNDIKVHVTEVEADGSKVEVALSAQANNYTYDGVTYYYEYMYKGVAAYEMANELYAYAYSETGASEQSAPVKYSVLEYAYKKLGKADKAKDETEGLENLLKAMLTYGSAAATFTDKTQFPADFSFENDYTYVSLKNATFEDGFSHGLYKKGEEKTILPAEGYILSDSADSAFTKDGETIKLTVPSGGAFIDDETWFEDNSANVSAVEKIAHEKENVAFDITAAYVGDTAALNTTPTAYDDVTITWSATGASIAENVVTFDTVGTATLTATIACDGESTTKEFIVTVTGNPYPVEGKAYSLKVAYDGTLYYAAESTSTSVCGVTQDSLLALNVYFTANDDVYYIYYIVDETKIKYIEHSSKSSLKFISSTLGADIPTDCKGWTLDTDSERIISNVDSSRNLAYNYNNGNARISTYLKTDTQYPAVWFEEIVQLTDEQKAQAAADAFELDFTEIVGADTKELPTESGAQITWSLGECENATLVDNVLTTTNPAADTAFALTATFTINEATATKNFEISLKHKEEITEPDPEPEPEPEPTEQTATLSFADKAQRTSFSTTKQVWEQNGITFTNDKGSGSNIADYAAPVRLYANANITIAISGMITKIEIACNTTGYANALKASTISGATMSVNGKVVTVTLTPAASSVTISKLSAQVRIDSLTVTYWA